MAKAVDEDERQRIIAAFDTGATCNAIAKEFKRSPDTISRIAASVGFQFGHTNLARAHEAKSSYGAEARARLAQLATERAVTALERMEGRYLVFNFGGRDNTYEEHELSEPPVEALRGLAATVRDLVRTVLDVDKHDNRSGEDLVAVDAWLVAMEGEE